MGRKEGQGKHLSLTQGEIPLGETDEMVKKTMGKVERLCRGNVPYYGDICDGGYGTGTGCT